MDTAALNKRFLSGLARFARTLHHGLALVGVGAIAFFFLHSPSVQPEPAAIQPSMQGAIRYDSESASDRADDADGLKQRALATYLSRRYRIASTATEQLVGAAYDAGEQVDLDPLLILAVMAIESRFNPIAESGMGAKGLMQVIPKHHQDKLGGHGDGAVLDPVTNILLGARILKEYIHRTGSLEAGLQFYNGALSDASSQYAQKVMAEKERLQEALRRAERQQIAAGNAT